MSVILSPEVLHRYLSSRRLHLLISASSLSNLSFLSLSSLPTLFLVCLLFLLFVLLLKGHDDAAPCAVLKSVDSFSFLQHPVHQRSLEILQRCKEEKHSKAAHTTTTPPSSRVGGKPLGTRLTNIANFTALHCSQSRALSDPNHHSNLKTESFYFPLRDLIYNSYFPSVD